MDVTEILKMIEEVKIDDSDKLREINARVHAYLYGGEAYTYTVGLENEYDVWGVRGGPKKSSAKYYDPEIHTIPAYTSNRSLLKTIRPKEWVFPVNYTKKQNGWYGVARSLTHDDGGDTQSPLGLPSEELAELYVILGAIDYERKKK